MTTLLPMPSDVDSGFRDLETAAVALRPSRRYGQMLPSYPIDAGPEIASHEILEPVRLPHSLPRAHNGGMRTILVISVLAFAAGLALGWPLLAFPGLLMAFGSATSWVARSYDGAVAAGVAPGRWLSALEHLRRDLAIEDDPPISSRRDDR